MDASLPTQRCSSDHLVLLVREMSRPHFVVFDLESGELHEIAFDEETYFLRREAVYEFDTSLIRFSSSSPTTPQETYDYDVVSGVERSSSGRLCRAVSILRPMLRGWSSPLPRMARACRYRCFTSGA